MKRLLTLAILVLALPAAGAEDDKALVEAALSAPVVEHSPDSSAHAAWDMVRHQISGSCKFEMECIDFLPAAVRAHGPLRGFFSYLDRVTRCSRVGTASYPASLKTKQGRIREDETAYRRRRADAKP